MPVLGGSPILMVRGSALAKSLDQICFQLRQDLLEFLLLLTFLRNSTLHILSPRQRLFNRRRILRRKFS